jgi:hypothetical protein
LARVGNRNNATNARTCSASHRTMLYQRRRRAAASGGAAP